MKSCRELVPDLRERKKQIFDLIFIRGYTDLRVASELGISRQYVHRIKKKLITVVKEEVLDLKEVRHT